MGIELDVGKIFIAHCIQSDRKIFPQQQTTFQPNLETDHKTYTTYTYVDKPQEYMSYFPSSENSSTEIQKLEENDNIMIIDIPKSMKSKLTQLGNIQLKTRKYPFLLNNFEIEDLQELIKTGEQYQIKQNTRNTNEYSVINMRGDYIDPDSNPNNIGFLTEIPPSKKITIGINCQAIQNNIPRLWRLDVGMSRAFDMKNYKIMWNKAKPEPTHLKILEKIYKLKRPQCIKLEKTNNGKIYEHIIKANFDLRRDLKDNFPPLKSGTTTNLFTDDKFHDKIIYKININTNGGSRKISHKKQLYLKNRNKTKKYKL